jgi:hypothetical protein
MAITQGWGQARDLPGKTKRAAFSGRHVAIILCAQLKLSTYPWNSGAVEKPVSRLT